MKIICDVRCSVINVGEIDTVKQEFEADIYVGLRWRQPKFDGRKGENLEEKEYWNPRVYFPNAVSVDERTKPTYYVQFPHSSDEAYTCVSIRMRGTFKIAMKLENFPFDFQELTITLTSGWRREHIDFRRRLTSEGKITDNVYIYRFAGEHEWYLPKHIECPENGSVDSHEGKSGEQEKPMLDTSDQKYSTRTEGSYPTYFIKLHAQRKPSYYIWNVVVPIICILALSFSSFVIDPDEPSERLGITVTMLLTAVAFKSVVSTMLPRISYLTLLDIWVLCNFLFQCLIVAQNAIIGLSLWSTPTRRLLDFVSGIVLVTVALVANISFMAVGEYQYIKAKRQLAKITKEYQFFPPHISSCFFRELETIVHKSKKNKSKDTSSLISAVMEEST